jgi:hypothetical protein
MPDARQREEEAEASEDGEPAEADALDQGALVQQGNVAGLLELAKAYRSGAIAGGRDMNKCFAAYRAAADLGSADAEYAVALFCMSGGVVPQDLKEGTTRLRAAAEKGSVPAKVYLGNLYELGIHYKADPEKADVWYRNAARGARVEAEPGSEAWVRALAELGCVRQVLALTGGASAAALDETDKARLLQRARAHGHGLKMKDGLSEPATDRPTFLDALQASDAPPTAGAAAMTPKATAAAATPAATPAAAPAKKPVASATEGPGQTSLALAAFGYTLLFAVAALGAGYAATLGARELIAHGKLLPGIGARIDLVFPIVFAAIGVLPTWLVYRLGTVLKAVVVGGALGGVGWIAWGTGQAVLHSDRLVQSLAFGIAGFLAGIFVLGLLGGTKKKPVRRKVPRPPTG